MYITIWYVLNSTYYVSPSVDRGGGHIGLPLSAQCVRVSEGIS